MELEINMENSIKHGTLIPEIDTDTAQVVSLIGRRERNEDRYQVFNPACYIYHSHQSITVY